MGLRLLGTDMETDMEKEMETETETETETEREYRQNHGKGSFRRTGLRRPENGKKITVTVAKSRIASSFSNKAASHQAAHVRPHQQGGGGEGEGEDTRLLSNLCTKSRSGTPPPLSPPGRPPAGTRRAGGSAAGSGT